MRKMAVGFELWDRTRSAMVLGWVGFAQFLPVFLLSLHAGHLADRVDRKKIVLWCLVIHSMASVGLALLSWSRGPVFLYFTCLAIMGTTSAFQAPASEALLPRLVPRNALVNGATWLSSAFQVSAMLGPFALGQILGLRLGSTLVYVLEAVANFLFFAFLLFLRPVPAPELPRKKTESDWEALSVGFSFVWKEKVLLSSLSMDLFAVLLGGVTALLPIFASDILHCGPQGYGALGAAPYVGAFFMALTIAYRPPMKKAGRALLWAVAGFGASTLIFAVSRNFWLSFLMLGLAGALDNISVVVRRSLVQLRTPDSMRGRVSAVNNVFIGSSNELGEFESGAVAAWLGAVGSAVFGGVGTLVVVAAVALLSPRLRKLGRLS
jgi:MFS family permease